MRKPCARLRAAILACLAIVCSPPAWGDAPLSRPNILLLVAEDMSARVRSFGDDVAVTPHLDALAARGVRYPNTFTTAGVCAPSRAALIMGMHQNTLGAGHMRSHGWSKAKYMAVPPPEAKAFPELLRRAGYFTYNTSKLDLQFSGVRPGQGPSSLWDAEALRRYGVSWRDRPVGAEGTDTAPFFGMYAFMETHESAIFPRNVWPRSGSHLVMMILQTLLHWGTEDVVTPEQVEVPPYYPDTLAVRTDIARHYNNIATMDREVGALLERLEADGLADETIVIWTTDHGDGLPRAKRELFDSGVRVPMIIHWPEKYRPADALAGSVDERLISFVDLAAIILSMAGEPLPETMHGIAVVGRNPSAAREYVFGARDRVDEVDDRQRSVRDSRYHYIRNDYSGTPGARHSAFRDTLDIMRELWRLWDGDQLRGAQRTWFEPRPVDELYDTAADPFEIHNLAADPAHSGELTRLRRALDDWQSRIPDLGAIPEAELAEQSWPGGVEPVTATPSFGQQSADLRIALSSATPGASIEFRVDDGPWRLYSGPLKIASGGTLEARAVRYGWASSQTSQLQVP